MFYLIAAAVVLLALIAGAWMLKYLDGAHPWQIRAEERRRQHEKEDRARTHRI